MQPRAKLALFGVGLLAVFTAGVGVGKVVGDSEADSTPTDHHAEAAGNQAVPAGLQVAAAGYTLAPIAAPTAENQPGTVSFQILDVDGAALTEYDTLHEKQLHLVVVRADTDEFRHVHPTMAPDGTWSIDWTWPTGGSYRVFADFDPAGDDPQVTLGRWVEVSGPYAPVPVSQPTRTAEIDGYTVQLTGNLTTGGDMLDFTVARDGTPVDDLEPYLGANGHLVALRVGDLAYLHVHPAETEATGPNIAFHAQAPSAGTYRLYLDFKHDGVVRTAEFTLDAAVGTPAAPATAPDHGGGHG